METLLQSEWFDTEREEPAQASGSQVQSVKRACFRMTGKLESKNQNLFREFLLS
jgi:hypothetical protein